MSKTITVKWDAGYVERIARLTIARSDPADAERDLAQFALDALRTLEAAEARIRELERIHEEETATIHSLARQECETAATLAARVRELGTKHNALVTECKDLCAKLRDAASRHGLGLGGERLDDLVIAALDEGAARVRGLEAALDDILNEGDDAGQPALVRVLRAQAIARTARGGDA